MLDRLDGGEAVIRGRRLYLASRKAGQAVPAYVAFDEPAKSERALRRKPMPTIPKIAETTKAT